MNKVRKAKILFTTSIATIATSALAQSLPAETDQRNADRASVGTPGEIVVTAQKREQRINDVPMSIAAFSGDTLINRGVRDATDLVKVVPGLTVTPSPFTGGNPIYTLRGVGFYEFSLPTAPAVTVYVDEIPLPYQAMTLGSTLDLERVEVLKGPQGLLFGQNSTGGAVNNIAAKPTDDLAYGGGLTLERFGRMEANGFVSGPLTDTLRARIAVRAVQGGEWQYSYTRDEDKLGAKRQLIGRLLLDWDATERLKLSFNVNGYRDRSDTQAAHLLTIEPDAPASASPILTGLPLPPRSNRAANWTKGWPMRKRESFGQASMRASYDLSDAVTFTSLTSYQRLKTEQYADIDGTPAVILDLETPGKIKSFGQELRLSGDTGTINWIIGGNYATAKIDDDNIYHVDELSTGQFGPLGNLTSTPVVTSQRHRSIAVFANADVELAERLTLTAGARYTKDRRTFDHCNLAVNQAQANIYGFISSLFAIGPEPVPTINIGDCYTFDVTNRPLLVPYRDKLSEDNVSWRGALNYKTEGGSLLYGSVSRGYKAGAFSTISASSIQQLGGVKQEELTAYELGAKVPMLDRRVQLNAALFYYNYKDKQLRSKFNDIFFGLIERLFNIPKSEVYGIDADVTIRATEGLTFSGAATYVKSKIKDFAGVNQVGLNQNFKGERFPYMPELTLIGDVDYRFPLRSDINGMLGANVSYRSASDATIDPTNGGATTKDLYTIKGYTLVDLRLGIEAADRRWSAQVFGRNVFNKFYTTNVFQALDTTIAYTGQPATYGISLTFRN